MGWALGGFGIFILFLLAAGATFIICRRYPVNWQWQCGPRDVWIMCEEWRRKIAWLWAPREEKVGLVKAQHPTAQAVPGLYRQSSTNSSQYIMHSDSDLRLDAQGAFTRFECVDRDLHPPTGAMLSSPQHQQQSPNNNSAPPASTNNIPPQPLRPAPQPRATARPRPSPLRAPNSIDYLRLRECDTSPLTPPPPPPLPGKLAQRSMFLFHTAESPSPPPLPPPPPAPHALSMAFSHSDFSSGLLRSSPAMIFHGPNSNVNSFSERLGLEEARKIRYNVQGAALSEHLFDSKDNDPVNDTSPPYGSYDIVHESNRVNFDSIFSPQPDSFLHRVSSNRNLQDLERITRYIQSLPDTQTPPSPTGGFFNDVNMEDDEGPASPAAPPPPAPPDPSPDPSKQQGAEHGQADGPEPTTGEKIFKALRAVTSQSYIDASDFYNSILSSAQHVQSLTFSPPSALDAAERQQEGHAFVPYKSDVFRKTCDLFSPELNQEAQRTAQQVYNSLQDPPASPLLVKELDQQTYSYLSDPSFTRTSEDIFNSLEQHRRTSVQECLNGFQDLLELETPEETLRRRNSQELLSAIEEVTLKRRLSLPFDDCSRADDEQHHAFAELANGLTRHASLLDHERSSPLFRSISPFDDFASLQRAISCDSVCSDTSVTFNDQENNGGGGSNAESPVVGLICVGLEHDRWPIHIGEADLIVSVLEARDLIAPDGRPAQNTFARVCLLPDRQTHVQTRLYKGTNCPSYQEKFYFPLDGGSLGRTLLVEVFSYELPNGDYVGGETTLLGEASLRLGPAPRPPATTWLPLLGSAVPTQQLGELMFSLSYLPTAERLTLVVVKARNLKGANETPGDFFVKVYMLQQGKKIHKKRTTIKRGEKSPIFNEAIIFSATSKALKTVQLRLTVAEVAGDLSTTTKAFSVGHVIVGASSTGRSQLHWKQMLTALRRPIAMWHPLRK